MKNRYGSNQPVSEQDIDFEHEVYIVSDDKIYTDTSDKPKLICTLIIIISNVIAYVLCFGKANYFEVGGLNYEYIMMNKEYGRFISHMFIHLNFEHLANNMFGLFIFGGELEKKLGSFRMTLIYFLSGIGSGIFSLFISHMNNKDIMLFSAGASGAVYGLFCACIFLSLLKKRGSEKKTALYAIVFAILYAALSFQTGVDIWSHVGGAFIGGVITLILSIPKWENLKENHFFRILAIIITICFCIIGIQEANIGKDLNELPDSRRDLVQTSLIDKEDAVTYGEGLNTCCTDISWIAFTSEDKKEVVDFTGKTVYKGMEQDIHIQFLVNEMNQTYKISYFAFNDIPQTNIVVKEYFDYVVKKHKEIYKQ